MTVRIGICVLLIAGMVGMAQGVAAEKRDNSAKASSNAKVTSTTAAIQSTPVLATVKPVAAGSAQTQKAPAKKKQLAAKPKSATTKEEPKKDENAEAAESGDEAGASPAPAVRRVRGQRDPFETVIRSQPEGPGCSTGKKCLVVDKMDLKGVVRSQNGMIAIVVTEQRKTYFLHENDPVYNGHVVKINPDSIVFRETVIDRVGRQSTRDVVKRIARPAA